MRPLLQLFMLKLLLSRRYGGSRDVGALSLLEVGGLRPAMKASEDDSGPETVERRKYLSNRRRTDRD